MRSVYSIAKLLCLLMIFVDASLGRFDFPPLGVPFYPDGYVSIQWDMMDIESSDVIGNGYTANVTMFNYLKNHDVEGPWELGWTWSSNETSLLRTFGAKGKQSHDDNKAVFVDDKRLLGANVTYQGLILLWNEQAETSKRSFSFQYSVNKVLKADVPPVIHPTLISPLSSSEYRYSCDRLVKVTNTPGYLHTWRSYCPYRMYFREDFAKNKRKKRSDL